MIGNFEKIFANGHSREAQDLLANITADKVRIASDEAEKRRMLQVIETATKDILLTAQGGTYRYCQISVRDSDVASYFRDRGFRVSGIEPDGGMLIEW